MQAALKGFPTPAKESDLVGGDLFAMYEGTNTWLCLAIEDDEGEPDGYVVFDGPQERAAERPTFLNRGAVRGDIARLPAFDTTIEPLNDSALPSPSPEYGNGDLVIDAAGEAWIAVVEHVRSKTLINLQSGRPGVPKAPRLFYRGWRLVLVDGKRRVELTRFGS